MTKPHMSEEKKQECPKCFVIMPISDNDQYPDGHFGRVYEYIIKPACIEAGFEPFRADDVMTTNYIALDIVKHIVTAEMAICDLSSKNPNVLYELGIRQAFNLPVTLVKDLKTERIFDIQGFRDLEYDETLRIDTVNEVVSELATIIRNTYDKKQEVNSLISLLGIEPAKVTERTKISPDTELILNSIQAIDRRILALEPSKNPITVRAVQRQFSANNLILSDFLTPAEVAQLKINEKIYHERFGVGTVVNHFVVSNQRTIKIQFGSSIRHFQSNMVRLKKIEDTTDLE